MKVAFFQPYLAKWRIEFLDYFISRSAYDVIVYDGGYKPINDSKSVSNSTDQFPVIRFCSAPLDFKLSGQNYSVYFSPGLFFQLLRDRPDVIITEGEINFINNYSIALYCWIFQKPFLWWSLGKVITRRKTILNKLFDPFVNFSLSCASAIIARNTLAKTYYLQKGFTEEDIFVAPNSMNHLKERALINEALSKELTELKGDDKVILYVGALVETKKPGVLLDIFNNLYKNNNAIQLWFVGGGPEKALLQEQVERLNLGSKVLFFGAEFTHAGSYFRVADVVAVPGLGGLVINHAMIFGVPVVSAPADGTERDLIIDEETGYLVEANDWKAYEAALQKVLITDMKKTHKEVIKNHVDRNWNIDLMQQRIVEAIEFAVGHD